MTMRRHSCAVGILAISMIPLFGGCNRSEGGSTTAVPSKGLPSQETIAAVPLGQVAGAPNRSVEELSMANPYAGDPQAAQQGKVLYIKMNCAGCHAYNGKGNMGPNLTDSYWRYGGLPIQIYKTIRDGRPEGMPAWGVALPPSDIWKLVAYIQSLGGTVSPKDYAHSRQGDQPGEQVAPEAQGDADAGSAVALPMPAASSAPPDPQGGNSTPAKSPNVKPKALQERDAGEGPRP